MSSVSSHIAPSLRTVPEAVLFDLDGTLVDSVEDILVAVNRLLAELGMPFVKPEERKAKKA